MKICEEALDSLLLSYTSKAQTITRDDNRILIQDEMGFIRLRAGFILFGMKS
jgi:hypothetical protein